jgi:flagellar biosynthesis/type III secretory pathway protein FliH
MYSVEYRTGLGTLYAAMLPPERAVAVADPVMDATTAIAAAYADGVAAGEATASAALADERALLHGLRSAVTAALTIDTEALRPAFAILVTALAEAVVMAELALSPDIVARLVAAALDSVVVDATTSVRLHPDDVAAAASCPVPVVAAPELARGSIVVVGPSFIVVDGLAARLAAITAALW